MSIEPKFAQGWYTPPPVVQLRQEFLNVYRVLRGDNPVRTLDTDYTVDAEDDWGAHFIVTSAADITLPANAANGREVTVANHSGDTVQFIAAVGVTLVSKDDAVEVDDGGAVGAVSGGNNIWYLYGALV